MKITANFSEFEYTQFDGENDFVGRFVSEVKPGTEFILTEIFSANDGSERLHAAQLPPRKNISGEPVDVGWAGMTNNVSVHARGRKTITSVIKNHGYSRYTVECEAANGR